MNIYLIGFMGTGKSTVGSELSRALNWRFLDLDKAIAELEGRSIPEIFSTDGEAYFRDAEEKVLEQISTGQHLVVATGGGAVVRPVNRDRMKSTGFLISLYAEKEIVRERVMQEQGRPLLNGADFDSRFEQLMKQRKHLYEQADLQIDTSSLSVAEIVELILRHPSFPSR
jgi:shikimate kinase